MEKILVIKIGSSVLLTKRHEFDQFRIRHLAQQIIALKQKGFAVVLVTSGAVGHGSRIINLNKDTSYKRQAAAGIGQIHLMSMFANVFRAIDEEVAQVLITKHGLHSKKEHIKKLLLFYLSKNIIPVVNENDVIELNGFGGNDLLAAEIARLLDAESLYILSTMQGSIHGVGGGHTKEEAINLLKERNIGTVIVDGKKKGVLLEAI
ncbi:MAG: hypothetical protein AAB553_05740 [Patescibacteria group bacterium]